MRRRIALIVRPAMLEVNARTIVESALPAGALPREQAFRGYEKQYFRLASAWSVVFLLAMSITFLAKLEDYYSRVDAAYVAVVAESMFIDIEHWRHFLILGVLWGLMAASRAYALEHAPARMAGLSPAAMSGAT